MMGPPSWPSILTTIKDEYMPQLANRLCDAFLEFGNEGSYLPTLKFVPYGGTVDAEEQRESWDWYGCMGWEGMAWHGMGQYGMD